ncbi:MAG: hypothetical protein GKR93_05445 [Gammaproteobacteria bacterium]|nr:hypothetical protein [Gammaproteobacteria bacterium]
MSDTDNELQNKSPWHLWLVGIFSLLWSSMGALDYLMAQTRNENYMSNFSIEQVEYFNSFPAWVIAAWACAVWGGVAGAILLLLRKKIAAQVFLFSLISMIATTIHNYGFANGLEIVGDTFSLIFTAVIFIFIVVFYLYSTMMGKRGVLK